GPRRGTLPRGGPAAGRAGGAGPGAGPRTFSLALAERALAAPGTAAGAGPRPSAQLAAPPGGPARPPPVPRAVGRLAASARCRRGSDAALAPGRGRAAARRRPALVAGG